MQTPSNRTNLASQDPCFHVLVATTTPILLPSQSTSRVVLRTVNKVMDSLAEPDQLLQVSGMTRDI